MRKTAQGGIPFACLAFLQLSAIAAYSQVIDPFYSTNYTFSDLGPAPDVPLSYGGLTLKAGDNNTLLIGGAANGSTGAIYQIAVTRDSHSHITGFSGTATQYAPAPYNDGGIVYGPGGVLFAAQWPANMLSQYRAGSTTVDKVIDLGPLGVASSISALNFVPAGLPGSGKMKIVTYGGGNFYNALYAPDGTGTYNVTSATETAILGGGPEGFVYIAAGSPQFLVTSIVVSEYGAGNIATYEVDSNGDPVVTSRRTFMTGLSGAEGAYVDPLTGDFLFSTFGGGNHVIAVQGFASTIYPTTTSIGPGIVLGGTPANMFTSDDMYYLLRPGVVLSSSQSPIVLNLQGNAIGNNPSQLKMIVESKANQANIRQTLAAYNYTTSSYDQINQTVLTTSDVSQTLPIANPAAHIGPGNEVKSRLSYKAVGPILSYPWNMSIDEATWRYVP